MPIIITTDPKHSDLYKKLVPSVVYIDNIAQDGKKYYGGGFLYEDKTIVTCAHVVFQATLLAVKNENGATVTARIKNIDEGRDLASLELEGPLPLKPAKLIDISTVQIGEKAVAIGHPFKFEFSYSVGVISQIRKEVTNPTGRAGPYIIKQAIQTDAALNPGNSGGPVFDYKGRVIGIASMIASYGKDSAGVAFVIPTPQIIRFMKGLPIDE